jgi:hypothetical protein
MWSSRQDATAAIAFSLPCRRSRDRRRRDDIGLPDTVGYGTPDDAGVLRGIRGRVLGADRAIFSTTTVTHALADANSCRFEAARQMECTVTLGARRQRRSMLWQGTRIRHVARHHAAIRCRQPADVCVFDHGPLEAKGARSEPGKNRHFWGRSRGACRELAGQVV